MKQETHPAIRVWIDKNGIDHTADMRMRTPPPPCRHGIDTSDWQSCSECDRQHDNERAEAERKDRPKNERDY